MKPDSLNVRSSATARKRTALGGGHMPMEWMDSMCWRLPSGKALAEFALQAGFLAPLILTRGSSRVGAAAAKPARTEAGIAQPEDRAVSLRETR